MRDSESTLRPGKTPDFVERLRESMRAEMDSTGENEQAKVTPTFDVERSKRNEGSSLEDDNWVARYPGQNSPHIGNGSGGVR